MDIDVQRFVALTLSLAAGACRPAATPAPTNQPSPADDDFGMVTIPEPQIKTGSDSDEPDEQNGVIASGRESCDADDVGSPKSCNTLAPPPGPHCESFGHYSCEQIASLVKPRIAEQAVDCVLAASGTREVCGRGLENRCLEEAVMTSCVDARAREACGTIVPDCHDGPSAEGLRMTVERCEHALSAALPDNRSSLERCLSRSCSLRCLWYAPSPHFE